MAGTIEPVFSKTKDPRFPKRSLAVRDSESSVVITISPADFEGIEDFTYEEIMRAVDEKSGALKDV